MHKVWNEGMILFYYLCLLTSAMDEGITDIIEETKIMVHLIFCLSF